MPKQPQQGELALKKKIPMKKGGIGKPKPKRNLDFVKSPSKDADLFQSDGEEEQIFDMNSFIEQKKQLKEDREAHEQRQKSPKERAQQHKQNQTTKEPKQSKKNRNNNNDVDNEEDAELLENENSKKQSKQTNKKQAKDSSISTDIKKRKRIDEDDEEATNPITEFEVQEFWQNMQDSGEVEENLADEFSDSEGEEALMFDDSGMKVKGGATKAHVSHMKTTQKMGMQALKRNGNNNNKKRKTEDEVEIPKDDQAQREAFESFQKNARKLKKSLKKTLPKRKDTTGGSDDE